MAHFVQVVGWEAITSKAATELELPPQPVALALVKKKVG